jgi:HSP20 family molecular chaperone IbpA
MSGAQELAVREKQELVTKEEKTTPGRYFVPAADIFETGEALSVVLEMPGVEKKNVSIALENDVLRSMDRSTSQTIKEWSRFIQNIMSDTTREGSRFQTRSTEIKSAHSLIAEC